MKMLKRLLPLLGLALLIVMACDKLNSDKAVLADDVASDDRGAKAIVKNVLLNTDIGRLLTDTSRFKPPAFAKPGVNTADTLFPSTNTWHCSATHNFGADTLIARYWVKYAPNFNGYKTLLTDTAYITNVAVNDSIDKVNTRIYISVVNTSNAIIISGMKNWINPDSTGALTFNGSLRSDIHSAVGKLTTTTSDDLNYFNRYDFTFVNLRVVEGSTVPSSGSVNFSISQDLVPDKDGLTGTINGDFTIAGVLTFSSTSSHTLTLGTYSYSVTIGLDRSITITPL